MLYRYKVCGVQSSWKHVFTWGWKRDEERWPRLTCMCLMQSSLAVNLSRTPVADSVQGSFFEESWQDISLARLCFTSPGSCGSSWLISLTTGLHLSARGESRKTSTPDELWFTPWVRADLLSQTCFIEFPDIFLICLLCTVELKPSKMQIYSKFVPSFTIFCTKSLTSSHHLALFKAFCCFYLDCPLADPTFWPVQTTLCLSPG